MGGAYGNCNGEGGCGTVFSITPSGAEKVLYSFKGGTSDGGEPEAGLLNVNGVLYGTTYEAESTAAAQSSLLRHLVPRPWFTASMRGKGDAAFPRADLINLSGTLYGTTVGGGEFGLGAVYSLAGF